MSWLYGVGGVFTSDARDTPSEGKKGGDYTLTAYSLLAGWLPCGGEGWLEIAHTLSKQKIITLAYSHPRARGKVGLGPVCSLPTLSLAVPSDTIHGALGDDPLARKILGL